MLLSDDGLGTVAIVAATGKLKTCVWRWQERFMAEGVEGLLRDRTRPPGIAPFAPSLVDRVAALTLEPPGHEATHWTVRAMAKAIGIAASSVVKIWHDHGLAPHRSRRLKLGAGPPHGCGRRGRGGAHRRAGGGGDRRPRYQVCQRGDR